MYEVYQAYNPYLKKFETHYVPIADPNAPKKRKLKTREGGCCGTCNERLNGCFDVPEASKRYPEGVKPGGTCSCFNCCGCCNREKVWVRRGESIDSELLKKHQIHIKSSRKRQAACC